MDLSTSTAFVTGANRGLGRHFAEQLVARGAKVYAGARNPATVNVPGVVPVQIDITDPASVLAAAAHADDVTFLINNAGSGTGASLLTGPLDDIRLEMETHYFGTLAVTRAFAPMLAEHDDAAVLNVLSVLSWVTDAGLGGYAAAKSAEWSMTNALRIELAEQGTRVSALHVGYMDTDLVRDVVAPKLDPAVVAKFALDGVAASDTEILADDLSHQVRAGLAGGVAALYPALLG